MAKRKFNKNTKIEEKPKSLGVAKPNQRVSRKTKRKEAKLRKKLRREKNCRKLIIPEPIEEEIQEKPVKGEKKIKKKLQPEDIEKIHFERRKKRLLEENTREDKNIHLLEKHLKLDKRKNIIQPFRYDGLDYLLEVCDLDKVTDLREPDLSDNDDNFGDDFAVVTGEKKPNKPAKCVKDAPKNSDVGKKRVKFDLPESPKKPSHEDSEQETESDEGMSDASDETDEELHTPFGRSNALQPSKCTEDSEDIMDSSSTKPQKKRNQKNTLKEDIYGRFRDKDGNVIVRETETQVRYVPPALREKSATEDSRKAEMLFRLRRQLKGLLNRLSESNLYMVCNEIEKLYMSNSRNDMNETLIKLVFEAVVQTAITPERMIQEHAVLVALLHANIGSEVGAQFLESIAKKLDFFLKSGGNYGNGKECDNLVLFLVHLYSFKIVHSTLIYDVLKILSDSFLEKDIDLILVILRSAGFGLRKDNPLALKETIISLQTKGASTEHQNDKTRVHFMLEILMAIRNNNMRKIPNYDTSHTEHLQKLLRNFIRKGNTVVEVTVSLADLLNADVKGRWWIVGSAWKEEVFRNEPLNDTVEPSQKIDNVSTEILQIAQKQRINTDTRKNIFCVLMTAEDYVDAFEKLMHLGLTSQQERNIMYVVIDCCLQEKTFNQFYAYLLGKFCDCDRKYQITVQYAVWDRIKELHKGTALQLSNLARLLSFLFLSKALPLSVLKVIQFAEMDKSVVSFLRQIMLELLLHDREGECQDVFVKISVLPKLSLLREGLRLFIDIFLLKNKSKLTDEVAEKLESRIAMVKVILSSGEKITRL